MNAMSICARLGQGQVWADAAGRQHAVATMERRHAANAAAFLLRSAAPLHHAEVRRWMALPEPNGTQAAFDVEDEILRLVEAAPQVWVRSTPLYCALIERADGHPGGPSWRWRVAAPFRRVIA